MTQRTVHDRLVDALKARGAIEITSADGTAYKHTVLQRAGIDWKYYVSSSGNLRMGTSWGSSVSKNELRRELMMETKIRKGVQLVHNK